MKYGKIGLLAAFLALGAHGAIPETAEGWYTPSEWKTEASSATYEKNGKTYGCTISADGTISWGEGVINDPGVRNALETSLIAYWKAQRNDEKIQEIGKNLHDLTQKTGIEVTNENTGQKFTIKFNGSIASASAGSSGGNIPATSDADDPADKKTLNWTDNTASAKLQLYGARTATSSTEEWWNDYGFFVPYLKGTGHLGWKKYGGFDGSTFDRANSSTPGDAKLLTLKGWYGNGGNCDTTMSLMLTKDDTTQRLNRQNHFVLTQYTGGQAPALHYVPMGDLMSGGGAPVDGKSVTTNTTDGAITQGVASLYGWGAEAEETAETLMQMLSDGSSEGRGTHYVLARVGTGEEAVLGYVPIGEGLDGVTWATNWTEAVEHITKEETIQIVSFVTNSWTHENFITNTWNHENFITNMWNHENFITNVFLHENFVTNVWNHENFITNTWNHENFITNTWNHENFITNIFTHENFVTNTWNHENFITNAFTHENFITNTWNHENFITNMWNHENFLTNVVTHENFITNVIEAYSVISNFHDFVTFQTNSYERLHTIENWNYVTNFIVRYLGGMDSGGDGGGDGGGGSGGGEDTGPKIAPEDDPYSEEYVPEKIDNYLLPVKNARNIVAITNEPFAMLDATKMLDFQSINTNKSWLAQIYGFEEAETGTTPVKRSDGEGGYKLEWVEHPAELLAITTNGIAEIRQWMVKNNVTNIFTSVVSNSEAVATMRTNFFAHVQADKLLDNESVWTNGTRRVEIKGYKNALPYRVPFTDVTQQSTEAGKTKELVWEQLPFADSDAARFGVADPTCTIEAVQTGSVDTEAAKYKALTLYGFAGAEDGQVPKKKGKAIEWGAPSPDLDKVSIVTNTAGEVALKGFADAAVGSVPQKTENGLEWLKSSSATNVLLAGAGINITDNGGGVITISAKELSTTNSPFGNMSTLTVVTDARYDAAAHKMQVKRRTLFFYGSIGNEGEWEDVFEAVSHKSEHTATETNTP